MRLKFVIGLLLLFAVAGQAARPQEAEKPLNMNQVMELVKAGMDSAELAGKVKQLGIDFDLTDDYLQALRQAGAQEVLINALRAARPKPLTRDQVLELVAGHVPSQRAAALVEQHSIDFSPDEEYLETLRVAGAEEVLLAALRKAGAAVKAELVVMTSPDAEVFLDGESQGRADAQGEFASKTKPGARALKVSLQGKKDFAQSVTRAAQQANKVDAPLADLAPPPAANLPLPSTENTVQPSKPSLRIYGGTGTGGLTGKCTGPDGAPLAGYWLQIERDEGKWVSKVRTNRTGEYTYLSLAPGQYKVTLLNPNGMPMYVVQQRVGIGYPAEVDFDMGKVREAAKQAPGAANPVYPPPAAEEKPAAGLKQLFDEGLSLYSQKRYIEAAGMFEQALPLARDKNIPIVLSRLADAWTKAAGIETNPDTQRQDQAKALNYYQRVLQVQPDDAALHNNTGNLYANMGRSADAAAEFTRAAELDPNHASRYYYNLGAIMTNQGDNDGAATVLKKATDLDPTNAAAWYWYGMALMSKTQIKRDGTVVAVPGTVEAFQTYLTLAPNGPFAAQAQASLNKLKGKRP